MENGFIDYKNAHERKMYGILKELQKTYPLYISEKSFSKLCDILAGICISAEEDFSYPIDFFLDFQVFLEKEYNIPNGPIHWTKFILQGRTAYDDMPYDPIYWTKSILQGRTEAEAFDYFFELLDRFMAYKASAEKPKKCADPYEEKLYEILCEIKACPAMYMKTPSVSSLSEIISDIELAVMHYLDHSMLFGYHFQSFIEKKYRKKNDPMRRWDQYLLEGRTEKAAFDLFFEELELFLQTDRSEQ